MSRRPDLVQQRGAVPTIDGHMAPLYFASSDQLDRCVFSPQVPGENPVHWIAERAPPYAS